MTWSATATPATGVVDVFDVSENVLRPSKGPVSIRVEYSLFPGSYSLRIYNSAGEHIKTLDDGEPSGPVSATYQWDGKNKYGEPCADGVYLFRLLEPYSVKEKRILLIN